MLYLYILSYVICSVGGYSVRASFGKSKWIFLEYSRRWLSINIDDAPGGTHSRRRIVKVYVVCIIMFLKIKVISKM